MKPLARRGIKFLHIGWSKHTDSTLYLTDSDSVSLALSGVVRADAACLMPAVPTLTRWQVAGEELLLQAADTYGDELVLANWDTALVPSPPNISVNISAKTDLFRAYN